MAPKPPVDFKELRPRPRAAVGNNTPSRYVDGSGREGFLCFYVVGRWPMSEPGHERRFHDLSGTSATLQDLP